jgi:hypothetical protein
MGARVRYSWFFIPLVLLTTAGCTWRITPPGAVERPGTVYVTTYGKHTRLALPQAADPHRLVEFGFGDWHYYALEETGLLSGLRALFWSEASAYSRRELRYHPDPDTFSRLSGGERSARLVVEQSQIAVLRDALEQRWRSLAGETVQRSAEELSLRRSDEPYHLFHNSNHRTAEWLRELGCEVRGVTILGSFRVTERKGGPVADTARRSGVEPVGESGQQTRR